MSKLLVIFGITGQQGASLATRVLSTPSLSSQFKIRGITRNPSSPSALAWARKGIEVVKGDLDDSSSLAAALVGAHTVYGMTNSPFDQTKKHAEIEQGKRLADAALTASAKYLIWSTTPSAVAISSGTLNQVAHFDAKADVEDYIRSLPIRHTFYAPGAFMQNFLGPFRPQPDGQGGFALIQFVKPETEMPLLDVVNDTGKFVGAMLENPDAYDGKYVAAAGGVYSFQEAAKIISKVSGKRVGYKQIPEDGWKAHLPDFMKEEMAEMMKLFQDYGYYGKETNSIVQEGKKHIDGITIFEEFVNENLEAMGLA
ncbi:hypothetical protein F5884DRAFT_717404 [Xylogone sp. PMI_703]|nr:hypothetical protein F5884DRAFT_717404 [Xylogone sp. PMI_703]